MSEAHPYRELLAVPHAKALIGWSLLARLPLGMTPFALLLLVRGEGDGYGAAGLVVAVYTIALGIGAPRAWPSGRPARTRPGAPRRSSRLRRVSRRGRCARARRRRHGRSRGDRGACGVHPSAHRVDRADRLAAHRPRGSPVDRVCVRGGDAGGVLRGRTTARGGARGRRARPRSRRSRPREPGRHHRAVAPAARPRDAAVTQRGGGPPRSARLARRAHRRPLRRGRRDRLRLGGARDAGVRGTGRVTRARWDRPRVLCGGQPGRRPPRRDAPAARRRPSLRGRRAGPWARHCSVSSSPSRCRRSRCSRSWPACRSPRPWRRSTPRSTARHAREPRPRRLHGSARRSRSGSLRARQRRALSSRSAACVGRSASGRPSPSAARSSAGCAAARSTPSDRLRSR